MAEMKELIDDVSVWVLHFLLQYLRMKPFHCFIKKRIPLVLIIVILDVKQNAHFIVISVNTWYITIVKFNFANKHLEILYTSGKSKNTIWENRCFKDSLML